MLRRAPASQLARISTLGLRQRLRLMDTSARLTEEAMKESLPVVEKAGEEPPRRACAGRPISRGRPSSPSSWRSRRLR